MATGPPLRSMRKEVAKDVFLYTSRAENPLRLAYAVEVVRFANVQLTLVRRALAPAPAPRPRARRGCARELTACVRTCMHWGRT